MEYTYDQAISRIESYRGERAVQKDIRQIAYSDWAIDEMITRLVEEADKHPELLYHEGQIPPADVIEIFRDEMEYMEDTSETPRQRIIFNIARREAENVLSVVA